MAPSEQDRQFELVESWKHPEGTRVTVRKDDGTTVETVTLTGARLMCGSAVIWLDGISGAYALDRVTPSEAASR